MPRPQSLEPQHPAARVAAAVPARREAGPLAVALAGMVSLAVVMGIGRFAFTPLLPMMLHDGTVTLDQGGWLATVNYIGYFVGAAVCMFIQPDAVRMVRWGLVATVLLTLGMALPGGMPAWSLWRTAAGVASAVAMVYTAAWCLQRLAELGRPELAGLIFCGPGLGIVVTGLGASAMVSAGWHADHGWLAFTVLAVMLVAAVWRIFVAPASAAAAVPSAGAAETDTDIDTGTARLDAEAWMLTLAYGLAGFGYIITATFLPVIARQALPGTVWADLFWPIFGAGVAVGAFLATRVGMGHDNRKLLTLLYGMQALGVAIAVVLPSVAGFALSSLLAGLPFTALVAFAMREARRLWGPHAPRLMGLMTASYGLGQIAGPPLATALVARTGGFAASLACAAAALALGALVFAWMRRMWPLPAAGTSLSPGAKVR
ncbi:YbfB/YjiJ family MFS transporter [Cupriavidus alkaliphilus]|uniref:YbfB/YjiJ family MFS transporter n=1 Tax=Cupriavidus alkaliphilus TaxID=942866 RepID=UPI00161B75B2|nr:YbfB/YjiJ family MFS transporter [Cupriavidus alkaliphilus]MBB3012139.1 MFS family permease [Cupriavidus alkaliphilus]